VLHEALEELRRDALDLSVVAAIEVRNEEVDERRDIFSPLSQRRHDDGDDLQAIVEVFAEASGGY
jgi:hypothetical protein